MRLVNITNNHPELVREQLAHTDAYLVELYSLGNSTVIYTDAKTHSDVVLQNKTRKLSQSEVDYVISKLLNTDKTDKHLDVIFCDYFVEITLHKTPH